MVSAVTPDVSAVLGRLPAGVTAVCALDGGEPVGLAASSFTVSVDPPLVAFSLPRNSRSWPRLLAAGEVGLSVLAAGQAAVHALLDLSDVDPFTGFGWSASPGGAVLVDGAAARLRCAVREVTTIGGSLLVLLRVHALTVDGGVGALVRPTGQVVA